MSNLPNILAEADPMKFVFVAIVMVIWIIGLIAQSLKKQQEQKKQRPVDLAEAIRQRLPANRPGNRPQRGPQKTVRQPPRQPNSPNWGVIAQPQRVIPPPVQVVVEDEPPRPREAPPPPQERPAKKTPFVDAQAVNRWLKPATLQQQFILTELLATPKCLRDE